MKKICEHCNDAEWPCFVIDGLCRMCQALRRNEYRASNKSRAQLDAEIVVAKETP